MSQSMLRATGQGTARFRERLAGIVANGHFRMSQGLWHSSIGLGTYLGGTDERTDAAYRSSVVRATELGCNVFDAAATYRCQRSERNIGDTLSHLIAQGKLMRDEVIVATKGGYIAFDTDPPRSRQEMVDYLERTFVKPGICRWEDFVDGSHCMTPSYLAHQLDQSLRNLKLDCIDIYYLHNPEAQLARVSHEEFYRRLRQAFEYLENAVAEGKIAVYGTATWNAYRVQPASPDYLSLDRVERIAEEVAGEGHHFKALQLPFNLLMPEAFADVNQPLGNQNCTLLEAAAVFELTVMSSASIYQGRLAGGLDAQLSSVLQGFTTDAQRAIQFARSTPGLTTALVGMSSVPHVEENLAVAKTPPLSGEEYRKLYN
ncbi:MAG: aldo/keto reductase [Blastocatellia bacterium]|nr:aldo/keto reductase [Blastocatellia bacterium]